MLNDPRIAEQFKRTVDALTKFFPKGLPALSKADWKELNQLEDRINEQWKSDNPSMEEVKKNIGEYRMFWFSKK